MSVRLSRKVSDSIRFGPSSWTGVHALIVLASMGAASPAAAQGYEDCLPSRYLDSNVPGPYTVDEMVTVRTARIVAQRNGLPTAESFGVGRLSGSYLKCALAKVPKPQAKVLAEARRYDRMSRRQSFVETSLGIDVGLPTLATALAGAVSTAAFDGAKEPIQKSIKSALVEVWKKDGSLSPTRVVQELTERVVPADYPNLLLTEATRNALKIAAYDVLQDLYVENPSAFDASMKRLIGVDSRNQATPAVLEQTRKANRPSAADVALVTKAASQASEAFKLVGQLESSLTLVVVDSASASKLATNSQRNYSDKEVRTGLMAWLADKPELDTDPGKLAAAAKSMRQQLEKGEKIELSERGLKALEDEANFRVGAALIADRAKQAVTAFNGLGQLANAIGDPGLAKWSAAGATVASTVANVATYMAQASLGPVGWISIASSVLQMGGDLNSAMSRSLLNA